MDVPRTKKEIRAYARRSEPTVHKRVLKLARETKPFTEIETYTVSGNRPNGEIRNLLLDYAERNNIHPVDIMRAGMWAVGNIRNHVPEKWLEP